MPIVDNPMISRNLPKRIRRNLLDQRFGSLVVVGFARQRTYAKCVQSIWLAVCDCGNYVEVTASHLTRNYQPLRRCDECKHKDAYSCSTEYPTWIAMRFRGNVCESWANSFEAFIACVGERPSSNHRLWRMDLSRPHEPGNSFWLTSGELKKERHRRNVAAYMASIGEESETLRKRLESVSRQRLFQLLQLRDEVAS